MFAPPLIPDVARLTQFHFTKGKGWRLWLCGHISINSKSSSAPVGPQHSRSTDDIFEQYAPRLRYASRFAKVSPNRCKSSTLEALVPLRAASFSHRFSGGKPRHAAFGNDKGNPQAEGWQVTSGGTVFVIAR
jgi:hypothetical protein